MTFGESDGGLEIGGKGVNPVSELGVVDTLTRARIDERGRVGPRQIAAERQSICGSRDRNMFRRKMNRRSKTMEYFSFCIETASGIDSRNFVVVH